MTARVFKVIVTTPDRIESAMDRVMIDLELNPYKTTFVEVDVDRDIEVILEEYENDPYPDRQMVYYQAVFHTLDSVELTFSTLKG